MDTVKENIAQNLALLWSIENSLSYVLPKFARKSSSHALVDLLIRCSGRSRENRSTIEAICKSQEVASQGLFNEQLENMLADIIGDLNACQRKDTDMSLLNGMREVFNYLINQYEATQKNVRNSGIQTAYRRLKSILLEYKIVYAELDVTHYGLLPPLSATAEPLVA